MEFGFCLCSILVNSIFKLNHKLVNLINSMSILRPFTIHKSPSGKFVSMIRNTVSAIETFIIVFRVAFGSYLKASVLYRMNFQSLLLLTFICSEEHTHTNHLDISFTRELSGRFHLFTFQGLILDLTKE